MDALRSWIINICTTVFFITAVEMLLPNNNLKKYSKFVLGLILMTVIINPLVKFLNKGTEVTAFINKTSASVEQLYTKDNSEYKNNNTNQILDTFKTKLEKLCEDKLKEKYSKFSCKIETKVAYNQEKQEYEINGIDVGVNDGTVEKVGKVEINSTGSFQKQNLDESKEGEEIKNYLSGVLDIPEGKIAVYKLT